MDRPVFSERTPAGSRKVQHRRPEPPRLPSVTYPERLRPGPDKDDDVAPIQGFQAHMNRSMFSLIAAAGSRSDFHPRFGEESSGSETEKEEGEDTDTSGPTKPSESSSGRPASVRLQSSANTASATARQADRREEPRRPEPTTFSLSNQLHARQSLPRLSARSPREKKYMSQSMMIPTGSSSSATPSGAVSVTPRDAPVMRRIIEAEATAEQTMPLAKDDRRIPQYDGGDDYDDDGPAERTLIARPKLADKLKEIFDLDAPEDVVSEYPCWLLKSVLLQGYLYITERHFCFYAYLPKKTNKVLKSGSLLKKVKRGPKYNRQWFVLKGEILSYYDNQSSQYFQVGHVDLRFATSATLDVSKDDSNGSKSFTIATPNRVYYFTADSASSAADWVKALQKVIFRTHNDGDSVKIALPIANVLDIEENSVIEFAKTVKIQVMEDEGSYAFDEYFFSFLSFGDDAISVMQSMVPAASTPHAQSRRTARQEAGVDATTDQKKVKTPLQTRGESTGSSASAADHMSQSRIVTARHASRDSYSEFSPVLKASDHQSESYVESMMASSGPNLSGDDFQSSGSQVLSRSDIFRPRSDANLDSSERAAETEKVFPDASPVSRRPPLESRSATPRLSEQPEQDMDSSPVDIDAASSPGLKRLIKAGQYPLQRAAGLAGMLHRGSKDMSALLATKSMDYVEKVSGMWIGGRKHYKHDFNGPGDMADDESNPADAQGHEEASVRFRRHFGLPDSERLLAAYFGFLHRVLPLYGKIYVSDKYFCFRSLLPGTKTRIILPLRDIETVHKEKGFRLRYSALVVVIQGFEELFFEFSQREVRDDCAVFLHRCLDASKLLSESIHSSNNEEEDAKLAKAEHEDLMAARQENRKETDLAKLGADANADVLSSMLFDDPRASILNFKPKESLRITCLTIGSRGDVQPYIALCKGLLAEGHKAKIATHAEFEPWVRSHGIDFEPVDGDPAELMRICVENGMFTYSFLKEASSKFRGWIDDLLSSSWRACQGSDVLIESPSAMAGIHIAEALKIPYFRAFTMPWTRTRAYPHAFAVPEHRRGGAYNWLTYVMFDNVFWAAIAGQVNRWRKRELRLPNTTLEQLQTNKVPFLYNFSPSVVVPPIDFSDWVRVTGYWFLDEGDNYQPDPALARFIRKAREDGKKLVYIGFGSIVVANPKAMTETIVEAVLKADVRCILSKGWSDRLGKDSNKAEVELPSEILQIKSCPHDWLFKQVDCAVHHGGAGTTGASLRAGLPTVVKPFFGDQFFFVKRIEDLQVGVYLDKLNVSVLSRAIWEATHSERMIRKARQLGERIRAEDGVGTAIKAIYRDMEYAKSLIKRHDASADATTIATIETANDDTGDEESWTFLEDEGDPELSNRVAAMEIQRKKAEAESFEDRAGGDVQ